MIVQKPLDELTWIERYKPIKNPIDMNASNDGHLFNPQGAEREFILKVYADAPRTIWTLMDDGSIVSGFHWVNRQGHFICLNPFNEDDDFIINGDDEEDEQLETNGQAFFDAVVEADVVIDLVEDLSEYEAGLIYQTLKDKFEAPLKQIHELMSGANWTPATLDMIADIMLQAGYPIADSAEAHDDLEILVRNAFKTSAEGGIDMVNNDMTDEEVAVDMLDCDVDIQGQNYDEVVATVTMVRNELLQELADQKHEAQSDG